MPAEPEVPLKSLVWSLYDSVMLLAPRGWSELELTVVEARGRLALAELRTRGEGLAEPRPRAPFSIDPQEEAVHLSEGLTELWRRLEGRWRPGRAVVTRHEGTVDWKLLGSDGAVAWFTRLTPEEVGRLLVTEALLDAVTGTSRAFTALQAELEQRLGRVRSFQFDAAQACLRLERDAGPTVLAAQLVGTYFAQDFTWVWSWSDPEAPAGAVERVRRACAPEAQPDGLSALWRPSYHCDEGFAWTVAGSVAVTVGARGLFRAPASERRGASFLAVLELPPGP